MIKHFASSVCLAILGFILILASGSADETVIAKETLLFCGIISFVVGITLAIIYVVNEALHLIRGKK